MANGTQTLVEGMNFASKAGFLNPYKQLGDYIIKNLNPKFTIREYQREGVGRFIYYLSDYPQRSSPPHLLFHMATGCGKTLLMAANILYLYKQGYRNFVFFVNSTNIIKKTKANFLDKASSKYLFADRIAFNDREVLIREVDNFEGVNDENINILFTTIQGLHSRMWTPQENAITFEDFNNRKVVFLSDEAHHINTLTKRKDKLSKEEQEECTSWEKTVDKILRSHSNNIMLEYTATVDLSHSAIREKYADKIIYQYTLREFRDDKFSKDVQIMQSDFDIMDRALQAVILSQYRRKVAEKHKLSLKPVVLIKSQKTIAQSQQAEKKFKEKIKNLKVADIKKIQLGNTNGIMTRAFDFFKENGITFSNLVKEIQKDFSEEKCVGINSKEDSEEKQILVNTLEDEHNEIRVIFTVNMLNEGWDVLNLFDIVRLYEIRGSRHGGGATISEAQLIGRGARYYPFVVESDHERFKRKYDDDLDNELRVLEELHYHSLNDSRYIAEIKNGLVKTGIAPDEGKRREVSVAIKDDIKKTPFWKNRLLFLNEKKKNDYKSVKELKDILSETLFKRNLRFGKAVETGVFDDSQNGNADFSGQREQKKIRLNEIEKHINRKALDKVDFYRFSNLKNYFPALKSVEEFLASDKYLGEVDVEVYAPKQKLEDFNNRAKYYVALETFKELAERIEAITTEYIGTREFKGHKICDRVAPYKKSEVLLGGQDKEFGVAMSETMEQALKLDIQSQDWYMYDENYGTSEEKYFIQFIRYAMNDLKRHYRDVYLLRNDGLRIYRFSDGKAVEPDFILFLTEKKTKKPLSLQLFVEPKGEHLIQADQWKEDFLKEIESHFEIIDLFENDKYRLVGLPFYNEAKKQEFTKKFERIIKSVSVSGEDREKSGLFFSDVVPDEKKYIDFLPVYTLEAACGKFGEGREGKILRWVDVKNLQLKVKDEKKFVSHVRGDSMEPRIKDGDYCLFRADVIGSRNDKIVLVQHHSVHDPDNGGRYTVKKYKSYKSKKPGKLNERVELIPLNKKHETIVFEDESDEDFKVVAEFIQVLE